MQRVQKYEQQTKYPSVQQSCRFFFLHKYGINIIVPNH
jgi:hypothetical protein